MIIFPLACEYKLIFLSYDPVTKCLPSSKSTIAVTAAEWPTTLDTIVHDLGSHKINDEHPWSLPEAKYFYPFVFLIVDKQQILELWPFKVAIFCPYNE